MADDWMYSDEIPWHLPPVPRRSPIPAGDPSTPDLVGMMTADVVALDAHLTSVTADLAITRELVQTALDTIVQLTALVAKQHARLHDQQRQIAALMDLR